MAAVLDDVENAPIDERLRAALRFVRKLTLTPDALDAGDIAALRAAGVTDDAARDAIYVCYLFSIYNRLGDALGFRIPANYQLAPNILLTIGYR